MAQSMHAKRTRLCDVTGAKSAGDEPESRIAKRDVYIWPPQKGAHMGNIGNIGNIENIEKY